MLAQFAPPSGPGGDVILGGAAAPDWADAHSSRNDFSKRPNGTYAPNDEHVGPRATNGSERSPHGVGHLRGEVGCFGPGLAAVERKQKRLIEAILKNFPPFCRLTGFRTRQSNRVSHRSIAQRAVVARQ